MLYNPYFFGYHFENQARNVVLQSDLNLEDRVTLVIETQSVTDDTINI